MIRATEKTSAISCKTAADSDLADVKLAGSSRCDVKPSRKETRPGVRERKEGTYWPLPAALR